MNNRDKLQKFSIRKYAIGTFSTVIATLVFVGFNPGQAHANEVSQNQKVIEQQEDSQIDEDNSNSKAHQLYSQVDNNQSRSSENNQPNALDKTTLTNNDENQNAIQSLESEQASTNSDENNINNQSLLSQEDLRINKDVINAKKQEEEEKENQDSSKKDNHKMIKQQLAEKRANKDDKNKDSVKKKAKNRQAQSPIDRNSLQALLDSSYHEYKMIDRDKANATEFNKVKATFDKVNELLGKEDNATSDELTLVYQELVQAIELARTLPQRSIDSNTLKRSTRGVNSDRAARGSVSYQNAYTEYYVSSDDDGSGYPPGTFLHASNKGAPYYLPTTPYNLLHASDVRNIAYITTKRLKNGYQWDVLFNLGHSNHENMIYWFAIPRDQTPAGPVTLTIINKDGRATSYDGSGSGSGKPLPKFWETAGGINPSVANYFRHGAAHGYQFYNTPYYQLNKFWDFARGSDEFAPNSYFNRNGASSTAKYYGDENYAFLNGDRPEQGQGLDSIYCFIGKGDVSYRISFKTSGLPTERLYYAAGGRALEFNQLYNYNQLYVEPMKVYQERIKSFVEVKNRTMHLGNTEYTYDSTLGKYANRAILDSDGDHTTDYADDPLSYVKNISDTIMGFMPPNAQYDSYRVFGVNDLNPVEIESLFAQDKLEEAARTGKPIKLMIGFNARDSSSNPETLVPVKLYVKPQLQQKISYWHNNEGTSIDTYTESRKVGHPVYQVMAGDMHNNSVEQQEIRIKLTSNEPIKDNDWLIYGYPHTLRLEKSTGRNNNAKEKNFSLVGTLEPGDYFITVKLGDKEEQFEVRAKPYPPTLVTTALQLKGKAGQKPDIVVTNVPPQTNAKVLLVVGGVNGRTDAFSDPYTKPEGYTVIARADATSHGTVTITSKDYLQGLPRSGEIKAITYFDDNVQSNFSNAITLITDETPPTIGEPVGLKDKYYRDNQVHFTIPVSDNQDGSGVNQVTIEGLPSGWTHSFVKAQNGQSGTLTVSGTISHAQALNSTIRLRLSASDMDNNVTKGDQIKTININVSSLAVDFPPLPLTNGNRVVVVNPTIISNDEKAIAKDRLARQNASRNNVLAVANTFQPQDNGNVLVNYKDDSQATMNEGNVYTYEPIRKNQFSESGITDKKIATIYVAKGSSFNIGKDMRNYFSLSNGQDIPNVPFTVMTPADPLPTPEQVSQFGDESHQYRVMAFNAYNKSIENLYIRIKAIDIVAPTGNHRVFRVNPIKLSDEEVQAVKQAFVDANPKLHLQTADIDVSNPTNGTGVSTVTVSVHKDQYTKTFTSSANDMNFLRWPNIREDYSITWSSDKLPNRNTDGGFSWSPDHKSIIYRYDATKGIAINTNQVLNLFTATTTVPGLRNNITGNEKILAEEGGTPSYKPNGLSLIHI